MRVSALTFIFLWQVVNAAKILLYNPLMAQSHVNFMHALTNVLIDDGHELTVLAPCGSKAVRFDGSRIKKLITFDLPEPVLKAAEAQLDDPTFWQKEGDSVFAYFTEDVTPMQKMFEMICSVTLNHTSLFDQLREDSYDLAITEYFDACGLGIFYQLGIDNIVLASSSHLFEQISDAIGAPFPSSYIPGTLSSSSSDELANSFWLRVKNYFVTEHSRNLLGSFIRGGQNALDKHFPGNSPSLPELAARSSLVFTNDDPLLNFARPTLHKVIDLAGIAVPKPEPVDKYWQDILNQRQQTVLISFGSIGKSYLLPTEVKAAIVKVIKRLPDVTFIWKYEKEDDVGNGVKNLVKTKWMPQNDLLNTGKISLFVTHGGMGSVLETAAASTPFIAIGIYADQLRNARMLESHGSGVAYQKKELGNANKLEKTLRLILEDESYAENARRLTKMLKARPFSPHEQFSRNIRFVIENGPLTRLSPVSTKMTVAQLYFLDALTLAAVVIVVGSIIVVQVAKGLISKLSAKHKKVD